MQGVRNPLLLVILNYIVGYMVARGIIQSSDQNQTIEILADIVGYGIILLTSLVSLQKVVKHKSAEEMQHQKELELISHPQTTVVTETTQTTVPAAEPAPIVVTPPLNDGGTPTAVVHAPVSNAPQESEQVTTPSATGEIVQ